jgi:hypothetical protein
MLEPLKEAATPKPVDPTLPMQAAVAKAHVSNLFAGTDAQWWEDARSGDLVQAGLNAVARWLVS